MPVSDTDSRDGRANPGKPAKEVAFEGIGGDFLPSRTFTVDTNFVETVNVTETDR